MCSRVSRLPSFHEDILQSQAVKEPFLEMHADIPDAEQGKGGQAAFLERLHRIEEHIRNNKLRVNLTDKIGAAAREKEDISNINEAKKLAFYIYWNVKANHDKYDSSRTASWLSILGSALRLPCLENSGIKLWLGYTSLIAGCRFLGKVSLLWI